MDPLEVEPPAQEAPGLGLVQHVPLVQDRQVLARVEGLDEGHRAERGPEAPIPKGGRRAGTRRRGFDHRDRPKRYDGGARPVKFDEWSRRPWGATWTRQPEPGWASRR